MRLKETKLEVEPNDQIENFEYAVKSKFYLNSEISKKPVKFEESLFINILQKKSVKEEVKKKTSEKRAKTNFSLEDIKIEKYLINEDGQGYGIRQQIF